VGACLAKRLERAGTESWNGLLLGAGTGFALVQGLGLGPEGFLAALLLVLAAGFLPMARGSKETLMAAPPPAEAPRTDLLPLALLSAGATLALLFFLPHLRLFDGGAAPEEAERWACLAAAAWLGSLTLGTLLTRRRLGRSAAGVLAAGAALGITRGARILDRFASPAGFQDFTGWAGLRNLNGGARLIEGDALYTPAVTLVVTLLPLFLLGAAWRILVETGSREEGPPLAPRRALGTCLASSAAAGLCFGFLGHPSLTSARGDLAFGFLLAAAALAAATASAPRSRPLRGTLALLLAGIPLLQGGGPGPPRTGVPFPDVFRFSVLARAPALTSLCRVLHREAGSGARSEVLAEGRNFLTGTAEEERAREMETAFALALGPRPRRALLVGSPQAASVRLLRRAGVVEVHAAADPPELLEAARRGLAAWEGVVLDGVTETAGAASGSFGLILVRDEALWSRPRNLLRPSLLATCAQHLARDGVLAVGLDPSRLEPGVVEAVAGELTCRFPAVEIWLLPRGWQMPRLLITGRKNSSWSPPWPLLRIELEASGLVLAAREDLDLLRAGELRKGKGRAGISLAPPLSRLVPFLAGTEYRREDEVRPERRAGRVLADLETHFPVSAEDSLLPFAQRHLAGQVYSVADTLLVSDAEKIDIGLDSLQALMTLTRAHPDSRLLRELWKQLGGFLVAKREVEWAGRFYGELSTDLGWRDPEFLAVLADVALEMLDPDEALRLSDEALRARPGFPEALRLRARALDQLHRPGEAAAVWKTLSEGRPDSPDLLRAWARALLEAGRKEEASRIAVRLRERFGREALGPGLAELLGLE